MTKVCYTCQEEKSVTKFGHLDRTCTTCRCKDRYGLSIEELDRRHLQVYPVRFLSQEEIKGLSKIYKPPKPRSKLSRFRIEPYSW